MISVIKKYFLKPFPFHSSIKDNTLISLAISVFIFCFLVVFQPFDFDKPATHALIYSGISLSILLLNLVVFPQIFTQFYDPLKWNIIRMFLFIVQLIFLTACYCKYVQLHRCKKWLEKKLLSMSYR